MKLAVSNIAWSPEERLEAYRMLQQAGVTGLEVAPGLLFHAANDPFAPEVKVASAAIGEISDAGLELVSMQSLLFGVENAALFEGPDRLAAFETGMRRAIELAGRFDIPNLVFGSPKQRIVPEGVPMEQALMDSSEVFRRLGDAAADAGTKIAIEPNPAAYGTNFLNRIETAEGFVRRVDHPAIVAILDLGAMHMNDAFDEVPSRVAALGSLLNHVHVSEPQLEPAPASSTDLRPLMRALREAGYANAVSIEMKRAPEGLTALEPCLERLVDAAQELGVAHA